MADVVVVERRRLPVGTCCDRGRPLAEGELGVVADTDDEAAEGSEEGKYSGVAVVGKEQPC